MPRPNRLAGKRGKGWHGDSSGHSRAAKGKGKKKSKSKKWSKFTAYRPEGTR